jgi:hypothetical protein
MGNNSSAPGGGGGSPDGRPPLRGGGVAAEAKRSGGYYPLLKQNAGPSLGRRGRTVTGGAGLALGGYFGGADEDPKHGLKDYHLSQAAQGKDRMIRGLARALQRAGIEVDPDASAEEIARALEANLPDPRKGKTFAQDAKAHEKVCKTIGDVLNHEFAPGASKENRIIDTTQGAASVCWQIHEIVHSLSTGIHVEFLEVYASLKRVLTNLEVLGEILREVNKKILKGTEGAHFRSRGAEREFDHYAEVYKKVEHEHDNQMRLLKNFLHVHLATPKKELEMAMRRQGESYQMVKKLKLTPGSSGFSDSLASAVSGLGTVASISARVDKALREVGLSVQSYLESSGLDQLETALNERLYSGEVDRDDFAKYLKAVKVLKENFAERSRLELGAPTEGTWGGKAAAIRGGGAWGGGPYDDDDDDGVRDDAGKKLTKLDRRVKARREEQRLIVSEFMEKSTRQYDLLLKAVQTLGPKLGREIPLSDKLGELRNAMQRLGSVQLGVVNVDLALLGVASEAMGRETKDLFVGALRRMVQILDELMGMELYRGVGHDFAAMRGALDGLIRIIDLFSDVISKKLGAISPEEKKQGGADPSIWGSPDVGLAKSPYKDMPLLARSEYDLDRAINTFLYFFYIAKVRVNLTQTGKELVYYGEGYADLLGDAVAMRIQNLLSERQEALTPAVPKITNATSTEQAPRAAYVATLKTFRDKTLNTKISFYRALQAIDLYMKAFTDGIVSHPDDVSDIRRIIEGYEVIGPWFTAQTGEYLADAFDMMPNGGGNDQWPGGPDREKTDYPTNVKDNTDSAHYYTKIATRLGADPKALPGVPFLPLTSNPGVPDGERVAAVEDLVNKAVDNFQALKNLVNAFVRIGDKFGGTELRRQVFMSPGEIYRALHDYLKQSALSYGTVSAAGNSYTFEVPAGPAPRVALSGFSDDDMAWGAGIFFGMADVGTKSVSSPTALSGNFVVEDRYLSFCIKAMGAKVLTVLGVYDLFERPKPIYQLTPVRMIIGGSNGFETPPPVIPEAAELYFRLPRLVEFYQDLFKTTATGDVPTIALLPELEGVFAGIIRLIFLRNGVGGADATGDYSAIGVDYSETEVQSLVREINRIYEVFRGLDAEKPVSSALTAFVMEVNRHYGVVKADELKKMYDLYSQRWRLEGRGAGNDAKANIRNMFGKLNPTDYAILPDETDTYSRSSAPSDRWALSGKLAAKVEGPLTLRKSDNKLDDDEAKAQWIQWKLLATFRKELDRLLDVKSAEGFQELRMTSYSRRIALGEEEMRGGRDAESKLGVAAKLIQGTGIGMTIPGADVDAGKAFIFHETVGVGLNTLGALYTELASVRQRIQALALDPLRVALKAVLATPQTPPLTSPELLRKAVIATATNNGLKYLTETSLDRYLAPKRPVAGQGGLEPTSAVTYDEFWTQYQTRLGAGGAISPRALAIAAEILFDQPAMMEDLVVLLQGLTATYKSLVTLRFPGTTASQVILDFGGLRAAVQRLMGDIRGFLDYFRPFLAPELIATYEASEHGGSLYWLEAHLVDELVRGFPSEQETLGVKNREANDLEGMARSLNLAFVALTSERAYCLASWATGEAQAALWTEAPFPEPAPGTVAATTWKRTQYGDVFCRLAFYSPDPGTRGNQTELEAKWVGVGIGQELGALFAPRPGPGDSPGTTPAMWAPGPAAPPLQRLNLFDKWSLVTGVRGSRSLLFIFNQILGGYLSTFYDPSSQKIYRTLIEGFALGSFSQAVMYPGFALPDLIAGAIPDGDTNWGIRGDPQTVLLQSLAYLLNVLTTRQNLTPPGPAHLSSTLSDVPPYVHESFRANLPTYVKLFDTVSQYGEVLKMVMSQTNLSDTRLVGGGGLARLFSPLVAATAAAPLGDTTVAAFGAGKVETGDAGGGYAAGDFSNCVAPMTPAYYTSTAAISIVTQVVDNIVAACYTMGNCALEVLRELADNDPLYLQTQGNSIGEYKTRWGKLPLMPLSLALTALKPAWLTTVAPPGTCAGRSTTTTLWPGFRIGQAGFKLAYGTRKLFGRPKSKFDLSDAPGVRAQLEAFNATLGGGGGLPLDRYESFLQNEVALLRFAVDFVCVAGSFAPEGATGCVFRPLLYAPTATEAAAEIVHGSPEPVVIGDVNAVYPLTLNEMEVMAIPESSYQDQEIKKFTTSLGKKGAATTPGEAPRDKPGNRRAEWLSNIIDMNIMPINVHALMRGIPLAPLYNYAYTFEQLTCLMFGLAIESRRPDPNGPPKEANTTREMFVDLLLDPYMEVDIQHYGSSTAVYHQQGASGLVWRIFRGDDSLMMGRPKFLSDQLFNKALFGTLYDTPYVYEETGPAGAGRMSRGHQSERSTGEQVAADTPLHGLPSWEQGTGERWAAANAAAGVVALPGLPRERSTEEGTFGLLSYPPNEGTAGIAYISPGSNSAPGRIKVLEAVGKARFDTRLVRNLVFITNVQRVLRLRLSQELTEYRNVLAKSHSAVNPGITEYGTIPAGSLIQGHLGGPQETEGSRRYDNQREFFAR